VSSRGAKSEDNGIYITRNPLVCITSSLSAGDAEPESPNYSVVSFEFSEKRREEKRREEKRREEKRREEDPKTHLPTTREGTQGRLRNHRPGRRGYVQETDIPRPRSRGWRVTIVRPT
jgi:hypothetical protein